MRYSLPLFCLSIFLFTACSKVSMENYNRLKTGQHYDEIVAIIGSPAHCDEVLGVRQCQWGDAHQNIRIGFVGSRALTMTASNLK